MVFGMFEKCVDRFWHFQNVSAKKKIDGFCMVFNFMHFPHVFWYFCMVFDIFKTLLKNDYPHAGVFLLVEIQ